MRRARSVLAAAVALAVVALVVVMVVVPPTKKAEAATRVVTKTFTNTNTINIPPNADTPDDPFTLAEPYPSRISVRGLDRARIIDVNVGLRNFNHSWPDDMDVLLVGPTGRNAIIMSDAGSEHNATATLTIDDEAPIFFPDAGQIVRGSYKPSNYEVGTDDNFPGVTFSGNKLLSTFDGAKPSGRWRLFVSDDRTPQDVGFLDGWSLTIKAKVRR